MLGYGSGMGAGGWMVMTVFWVGLLVLIGWAVARAFPSVSSRGGDPPPPETPEEVLDRRFAAGELDTATYQSIRACRTRVAGPRGSPRRWGRGCGSGSIAMSDEVLGMRREFLPDPVRAMPA